jgi:DNA invertase Pin-like site-specific DNA recombinase
VKEVIELIRVSTEHQAASDRASIPAQRAVNRRTCQQHGLEIVCSIEMADVGGTEVLRAPEIQQLVRLMESPEIHGVVAREFSRLMRPENFADYALLQVFVDTRTVLYLPDGPIDFANKSGRLVGSIRAAIAGMERSEILERIWTAKEEKRRRGELGQSQAVLGFGVGYDKEQRRFFYKPEAERVREAFRQLLTGNHSYQQLAQLLGVTPRGMHLIFRNPIWCGWRVIDKKRDLSPAGRYQGVNGRQADRRKIARPPEEIIKVKVIDEPLISEEEFQRVQHIMDLKQKKHWRSRDDYEHRFTYHGFVTCAQCGEAIHTCHQRKDYYVCRSRRLNHVCKTGYMAREKLEGQLDTLFAQRLTDRHFLSGCVELLTQRALRNANTGRIQQLTAEIQRQRKKRENVIDMFADSTITREDRERRLAVIDHDISVTQDILLREAPTTTPTLTQLASALAPLAEWRYWNREQKRKALGSLLADIVVADYNVDSVGVNCIVAANDTHPDRGSWRRRA